MCTFVERPRKDGVNRVCSCKHRVNRVCTCTRHLLTGRELQRLLHHVLDDGVLVRWLGDAHGAGQSPPRDRVPSHLLVPAGRVLQQVRDCD